MSYDLVRLALLTLPPVPEVPYNEPEINHRRAIRAHPLGKGVELDALNYVVAVQRWLMAVRWRASLRRHDPAKHQDPRIPYEEWKRLLRPWLASLTTEAHSAHGLAAGFDGWNLLIAYMHRVDRREDPTGLGEHTLDEARGLEADAVAAHYGGWDNTEQ